MEINKEYFEKVGDGLDELEKNIERLEGIKANIDNFIGAIRLYMTVVGTTRQIIKSLAEGAGYLDINKFELEQTESEKLNGAGNE